MTYETDNCQISQTVNTRGGWRLVLRLLPLLLCEL